MSLSHVTFVNVMWTHDKNRRLSGRTCSKNGCPREPVCEEEEDLEQMSLRSGLE